MRKSGSFVIGTLFVCTISLVMLGVIMVLSSSQGLLASNRPNINVYEHMGRQLMWVSIGLAAMFFFSSYDYNRWERKARWLMLLSVILLAALFTPLTHPINGARRWLILFGFRFQPSDFAKITIIMYLAAVWAQRRDYMESFFKAVFFPMCFVGFLLLLIILEPDHGTTAFIGVLTMVMWFAAGGRVVHLIPVMISFASAVLFALYHYPSLYKRIDAWLQPEKYIHSKYYQVYQSLVGFAKGGWGGVGLGDGEQQLGFTPEPHTDFIFSIMGEELGFVKCTIVLMIFLTIILLGYLIAYRCSNPFGALLAVGCTTAIGIQSALNIAVVTGSIPTTGIALPFISYGGSSLTISMSMIGMLMNIAKDAFVVEGGKVERRRRHRHAFA